MVSNAVTNVLESDSIYSPCANLSVEQYRDYDVPELNMSCEEVIVSIAVSVTFATGFLMVRYMYRHVHIHVHNYVLNYVHVCIQ